MNSLKPRPRARTVILAAGAIGVVLALTGCIDTTPTSHTPTATRPPSHTSTPSASPTATAAPGIPVALSCAAILTPQQVYDYNPNDVQKNSYKPAAASLAALAASQQGRVCGWVNESSGAVLEVAVARPGDLATLKSEAAAAGTPVQLGAGGTGYFQTTNGRGQLQVFRGTFWVIVSAADIGDASDAEPVAQAVLGNIPAS